MRKWFCKLGLHNYADFTVTLRTNHRDDMEELHEELMELYDASPECEHGMYLDAVHGIVVEICKDCGVMNARPQVLNRVEDLESLSGDTIMESYVSYDEIYLKKIKSLPEPEYTLSF